jgi:hypothetical protein
LVKLDVNHDGESVDRPSVSTQSGERTLQREKQAYAGNDHHDEDVRKCEEKHVRKCEEKHEKKCEMKYESTSKAEYENKIKAKHQRTHHDMSL